MAAIDGTPGNDTLTGTSGDDSIRGFYGNDVLSGGAGNDQIYGGASNDQIYGGAGNDTLDGGAGQNALYGGLGNDFLQIRGANLNIGETQFFDGGPGDDQFVATPNVAGMDPSQHTILGGDGDDFVLVEGGVWSIDGGTGNDLIIAFLDDYGRSIVKGGTGNDFIVIEGTGGWAYAHGGSGDDEMIATVGAGTISGGAGDDELTIQVRAWEEHSGATMTGGRGADTFILDILVSADAIVPAPFGPAMHIHVTDYTRGDGDRLSLLSGNKFWPFAGVWSGVLASSDLVLGMDLPGSALGDRAVRVFSFGYDCGVGLLIDTNQSGTYDSYDLVVMVDGVTDLTEADFLPAPGIWATATGNDSADSLTGGTDNDALFGGGGNDTLLANAGDDLIDGGEGDDFLSGGFGNDDLYGSGGNDALHGSLGNDWLCGGEGRDSLLGGAGDDRIFGNEGADSLRGGAGNDWLSGDGGNDTLWGGDGNDDLSGGNGNDLLRGGAGNDRLFGDVGDDSLDGGYGNDSLVGGYGNDLLDGGAGRDVMHGGLGADIFRFEDPDFSGTGPNDSDNITDFTQGEDRIDLRLVDAIAGGADDPFAFIGSAAFSGTAGELRYEQTPSSTMVYGDTDGDGSADFAIKLTGLVDLTAADFVL